MRVDVVHQEKYWYPDDGGIVWVAGFHLVDERRGFVGREAAAERGLIVTAVAGAGRHHAEALPSVELGQPLTLRRDPGNPHDPNAIAVHAGEQVGWVPRDLAIDVAADLDAGRPWSALALREQRASPREPRTGITMLLAPEPVLTLHVR